MWVVVASFAHWLHRVHIKTRKILFICFDALSHCVSVSLSLHLLHTFTLSHTHIMLLISLQAIGKRAKMPFVAYHHITRYRLSSYLYLYTIYIINIFKSCRASRVYPNCCCCMLGSALFKKCIEMSSKKKNRVIVIVVNDNNSHHQIYADTKCFRTCLFALTLILSSRLMATEWR